MAIIKLRRFIESKIRAFGCDQKGMLPVIFAISVIPALGLVGTAIDFSGASRSRAALQSAADAAALEAVTTAEKLETEAGNKTNFKRSDTGYDPVKRAHQLFSTLADATKSVGGIQFNVEVEREGNKFRAKATYTAVYKNMMPGVVGANEMPIAGLAQSTTTVTGSGHMDVYTLLDTSSSMGIGASQVDIDNLKTHLGCAFSCHGEKPVGVPVQLRIDVMRDAVLEMIKSAKAEFEKQEIGEPARIRIALNKFDHDPYEILPLSSDYTKLKAEVTDIKLSNYYAGTDAKKALNWLTPKVPASGDGLSAESPRRFVFFVTDGLQDRFPVWYPINFLGPYGAGDRIGSLDPAACQALKSKGVTVGVLYTTHVGIKDYEWYWKKPQPQVRPRLEACASHGFFFEASNGNQLQDQFRKMFQKAVNASMARLEK